MRIKMITFGMSGSLITFIGAIIAAYGAVVSANENRAFKDEMRQNSLAYVDDASKRDVAIDKSAEILTQNLQQELSRSFTSSDAKEIIEKAKIINKAEQDQISAKKEKVEQDKKQFRKILQPIMNVFNEEFKLQISALEKEGVKFEHKSYEGTPEPDVNSYLNGFVHMSAVLEGKKRTLRMWYSPPALDQSPIMSSVLGNVQRLNCQI